MAASTAEKIAEIEAEVIFHSYNFSVLIIFFEIYIQDIYQKRFGAHEEAVLSEVSS